MSDFGSKGWPPSGLLEKRKIGICGSSRNLEPQMQPFCEEVGRCLAATECVCVVVGAAEDEQAVEWHTARATERELQRRRLDVEEHLATVPRPTNPNAFQFGRVWKVRGKTSEARRFAFVRGLDGLIALGGGHGTDQELALAFELGIPVLPVPTFPGREDDLGAPKYWNAYREELLEKLKLEPAEAARWEAPVETEHAATELAREMTSMFVRSLTRRCFVITPFSDTLAPLHELVIASAVQVLGDTPINLKYLGLHGDAVDHVRRGIKNCDYVIAVLEEPLLNVLYELGFAHALGKPTVLLKDRGRKLEMLPFDISTQNRVEYDRVDAALRDRLVGILRNLGKNG